METDVGDKGGMIGFAFLLYMIIGNLLVGLIAKFLYWVGTRKENLK